MLYVIKLLYKGFGSREAILVIQAVFFNDVSIGVCKSGSYGAYNLETDISSFCWIQESRLHTFLSDERS
jgi:hypothetical protein